MAIYITCIWHFHQLHDSIVVSIPACHAGDRGSIPRRGVFFLFKSRFFSTNEQLINNESCQITYLYNILNFNFKSISLNNFI